MRFASSGPKSSLWVGALFGLLIGVPQPASAQDKVTFGALTFPTLVNTSGDIIKAKGFDKANGIDAIPVFFGSPGAQYAAMAKGEIVSGVVSPFQLAKMRGEGVPAALYGTLISMTDILVLSRTPEVKEFKDLKGRSLAATVGFSEFQYMEIYARKIGIEIKRDIDLVDASTSLAMAQLQAGRVDAIIVWEPSATTALKLMPDAHVILTGDQAWKTVTGGPGWDVMLFVNTDWAKANPAVLPRMIKMYQAYGAFLASNPEESDSIITSGNYVSKGLPAGVIATGIKAGRLVADVHASWEPETNKQIWQVLQLGVDNKEIDALPDKTGVIGENPAK